MDIGEKIKSLRQQLQLTQGELADRAELSKGFISQLERNLASPSIATLTDILECLGTNLTDFFSDDGQEKIAFTRGDMFEKEDEDKSIVWLVPNAQKNQMEPILLSLAPGSCTMEDNPHQGEEFGYVLLGSVTLTLGSKTYKLKKGDSFYFKACMTHFLKNNSNRQAQVVWVSCPPMF